VSGGADDYGPRRHRTFEFCPDRGALLALADEYEGSLAITEGSARRTFAHPPLYDDSTLLRFLVGAQKELIALLRQAADR
jgi:hypothetical protein